MSRDPVFVYSLQQSLHWFMIGLTFPILILFLIEKGLNIFEAGACFASYSATTILLELPTGGLADSMGRKRVYIFSLMFSCAGGIILLISWSFVTIVIGVVALGCARALSSGTIDAWFVDAFKEKYPKGDLQKGLSRANTFIPIGIAFGSLVGGAIPSISAIQIGELSGFGPFSMNIVAMEIMVVVQFFVTSALVQEHLTPTRQTGIINGFKQTPQILSVSLKFGVRNRVVLMLLISSAALGISIASVELLWQPRAAEIVGSSVETWSLGVLAAGYFFASSLGNLVSYRICGWLSYNYLRVLLLSTIATAFALFLLSLQNSMLTFSLLYVLLYFVMSISSTPQSTMYNAQVPADVRSTLLSLQSLVLQIGGLIGSLALGYLANVSSISSAWMVASVLIGVSSLTYVYLSINRKRLRIDESGAATQLISP